MDERLNWLLLANKFALDGDPRGMRACARELFDLDPKSAHGPAVMAEAALYSGNLEEAENLALDAHSLEPKNIRARMVLGGVAAQQFDLEREIELLAGAVRDTREQISHMEALQNDRRLPLRFGRKPDAADQEKAVRKQAAAQEKMLRYLLYRALGWLGDAYYLAADPERAADALEEASSMAETAELRAELYSKHLFLRNYRDQSPRTARELAEKYQSLIAGIVPYSHDHVKRTPGKKLRVGYISPDFRQHAVANFVVPFFRDFDREHFTVYCYSMGAPDAVTDRLRRHHVSWRNLQGRPSHTAARLIADDHVDILVDLTGHSQDNALPVLAMRPAPIQMCAVGYTATTGMAAMDYFLSDSICLPEREQPLAFTEQVLRLSCCHLCYVPGFVREMPPAGVQTPVLRNGYVTYGSFNNCAKITDDMLYLWRAILEQVEDSRLVIKGKLCSIPSGRAILESRLKKLNFPMENVELRPYSPDYLEQYRDIDIALDTSPYTGGLTTCEALYMGVPVVTLRGRSHGARFGATILTHADLAELIAENSMEYIKKAVQLGKRTQYTAGYHAGLREHMLKSPFMDAKLYMSEIEACYKRIWADFCK